MSAPELGHGAGQAAAEDRDFPCMATGETDVDGAVMPVACDLRLGHERSHWDATVFTFWGREHGGREYPPSILPPGASA